MFSRLLLSSLAVSVLLLAPGCPPEETIAPTLTDIQAQIFDNTCSFDSCHGGSTPEAALDLSSASASLAGLVGVESSQNDGDVRVVAGSPDQSLLYLALLGDVGSVNQMPVGYEHTSDEIEAIRTWIEEGAQDN